MAAPESPLGPLGEKIAGRALTDAGCRILARNFRIEGGEIDLIVEDGDAIVFVEVKTRHADDLADPEQNVNAPKQRRMMKAARVWLEQHRYPQSAYRFDVVAVVVPPDGPPRVRRIVEAFIPDR